MTVSSRTGRFILFIGDVIVLSLSLWLMLVVRYAELPSSALLYSYFESFALLFILWIAVFFIAGLYEKRASLTKTRLPQVLFNSLLINSLFAIIFFYFIPYFGITPKTNLFIYLIISFILMLAWRIWGSDFFTSRRRQSALLIGSGNEIQHLYDEVNNNPQYPLHFVSLVDLKKIEAAHVHAEVEKHIKQHHISVLVVDFRNDKIDPLMPSLYELLFSRVIFLETDELYEELFDRIPLSMVNHGWFLEKISTVPKVVYDFFKRLMDITLALALGIISLVMYPFVFVAIKIEDGGSMFIVQERVGQGNKKIRIVKLRTMKKSDQGVWVEQDDARITKVGKFLRKSRLDELPQLWNVLLGDMSLIGPRPDIEGLSGQLTAQIPYYSMRNLIKPGLSGWAQIKQDAPPQSLEETKLRLAYDFYYIKNRSFILDIEIALRTLRTLFSRLGI